MAKRLSEKQKEEIVRSFKSGIAIDVLSQNYSCTKSTIIRNLKKNLGEKKYKETITRNKIEKNSKVIKSIKERNKELKLNSENLDSNLR